MKCDWTALTAPGELARFGEIMRLMDDRYCALSTEEVEAFVSCRPKDLKYPELFGWFEGGGTELSAIRQVMATTCFKDEQGRRSDLGVSMLGIAKDVIPESEWTDEQIETWLGRFVLCVKSLIGLDVEFRAIRPKTMTWKPAEQLHDLVRLGIDFPSDDPEEGLLHAGVVEEKDLGNTLYWKMRIVRTASQP